MNQKRNIGLDMARVLAIVLVWINHSGDFAIGLDPVFMEFGGVFCIEVFFTLSGLLVGRSMIRILTAERSGPALKRFYGNRLIRTLPLYYLSLLLLWGLWRVTPPLSCFFFLQNFNEEAINYFPPSWSLPIEMWFYFLIPVMLLGLVRLFSRKCSEEKAVFSAIGLLCLIPFLLRVFWVVQADPTWDFGVRKQIFLRLDSLMMGVFLAALKCYHLPRYQSLGKPIGCLLLSLLGIFSLYLWFRLDLRENFDDSNVGRIGMFTLMPFFCLMLVVWLDNATWPEKLRGTIGERVICGISSMGYSIYLLHWIVFQLVSPWFAEAGFLKSWLGFFLAIGLTLCASWATYRWIEVPLGKWKERLLPRKQAV